MMSSITNAKRGSMQQQQILEYGEGPNMKQYEKNISFLNRYFVYKKIRTINSEKMTNILIEHLPMPEEYLENQLKEEEEVKEVVLEPGPGPSFVEEKRPAPPTLKLKRKASNVQTKKKKIDNNV